MKLSEAGYVLFRTAANDGVKEEYWTGNGRTVTRDREAALAFPTARQAYLAGAIYDLDWFRVGLR